MGSLLWITALLVTVHGQHCNDNHKRDELMHKIDEYFNHHTNFDVLKIVMEQYIYPEMYLIDLGRHPQDIQEHGHHHHHRNVLNVIRRGHADHAHELNHEIEHLRKEMEHIVHEMHHLNDVCVFEILYMIEEKLGLPHLGKTTVAPHTQHVTTQPLPTTQPPLSTTTTTVSPTTTLPPLNISNVCNGLEFVQAAALGIIQVNSKAGYCSDRTNSQSEALVLNTCHSGAPGTWTKGYNVMQNCRRIPKFTPIATFVFGMYPMDGTAMSGVFIKCTTKGFQMSVQICGHGPKIFDVEAGSTHGSRENGNNYYTINW
ncbi:uncharacterized protein LOC125683126 isoform X2 [Ostrea edulis]|uniref:uncharacterized protein LOC125683126 isoform X2 n=1 Tax=Ostrea edulis TaxID=37623 RepID=UPI0020953423|nr:uncharacterized protein LOC125683126 isoform X2 [Ostrea edulis]